VDDDGRPPPRTRRRERPGPLELEPQWSQATYLLLVENHVRGEAFGLAPDGRGD